MAKQLTEEEMVKNVDLVGKLVDKMPAERASKVKAMLGSPVGESYFTAPASSQEKFHSCYPGGLVQHSLNVVTTLKKLADSLCPNRWPNHTLTFVGLFHDLGKAGDGTNEFYLPNKSDWHREKLGKLYEINPACDPMPTSERGLFILQLHGISVTAEEYLAIRLNDGPYVEENKFYAMKEPDLALLVHWADRWSTSQEKPEV